MEPNGAAGAVNGAQSLALRDRPVMFGGAPLATEVVDAGPGPDMGGGMSRFSLWQLLKFKWSIGLIVLLLAAPSIAAVWKFIVPVYKAKAVIQVSPIIQRIAFNTQENGMIPLYQQFLNSQVGVITSNTVLQRVLDNENVRKTSWYRGSGGAMEAPLSPLERLQKALSAKPRPGTQFVDVTMDAENPADAALILNELLVQYQLFANERTSATSDSVLRELEAQKKTREERIAELENSIASMQKQLKSADPDALLDQQQQRLDDDRAKLENLERSIKIAKQELAMLTPTSGPASQPATQPATRFEDDPEWSNRYVMLKTAQSAATVAAERFGEGHPQMKEARQRVALAEELLKEREEQLKGRTFGMASSGLALGPSGTTTAVDRATAERRIGLLELEYSLMRDTYQANLVSHDKDFESAAELKRRLQTLAQERETYNTIRSELEKKNIEKDRPGSITVLSTANAPSEPDRDRRVLLTVAAVVVAVGLGFGQAYIRAIAAPSVQTLGDIGAIARAPFLGRIPLLKNGQAGSAEQFAQLREAIRMIRTAVLERIHDQRGTIVMATSAGPGAGKTTMIVMLARSLAQCGKRVLLVDADVRAPSIAKHFDAAEEPGLLDLLKGKATEREVVAPSDTPGLSIAPAGRYVDERDPELLANGTLKGAFDRWRKEYDVILLDSSPVLPVADARILARQADATILVVRASHCQRPEVYEALASLSLSGARLIGTVFVTAAGRRGYGGGAYGYGYGHGYGRKPEHAEESAN